MSDPHMALKVQVLPGWDYYFGVQSLFGVSFILAKYKYVVIYIYQGTTPCLWTMNWFLKSC